jgi:hypothetical protein
MALLPSRGLLRNDIGAYGGAFAKTFPSLNVGDIGVSSNTISITCPSGQIGSSGIALLNLSSKIITIDSVALTNTSLFSLNKNFAGQVFDVLTSDSIKVNFRSDTRGKFYDTIKVFNHVPGITSPLKIAVIGSANCIPYLNKPIPTQTAPVGILFSFQIADSTFLDNDIGDTLTYQATGMPAWLSFDPQTRIFQGTPPQQSNPITQVNIGLLVRDLLQAGVSTFFTISIVTTQTSINMTSGWNLVSVPRSQSNDSAAIVFPGKVGSIFEYNTAIKFYKSASNVVCGQGYWVLYKSAGTITISGLIPDPLTVTVAQAGWVLIGSHESDLPLSSLVLSDGAMISGDIAYCYIPTEGYVVTGTIKAGQGCWILVDKACTITIP